MSDFLCGRLSDLQPYTPGEQPQEQVYIKLNTNESPYPPSPAVAEALDYAQVQRLRLYSDPACRSLTTAIARCYGITPQQVMVGNGSDEVLAFAIRAFCDENTPLAFADITYGCYGVWCGLLRVPEKIVPLKEDFSVDVEGFCHAGATVMLANPNAPTGKALGVEQIEHIVQQNPHNVVIVDEAYVDFGAQTCLPLIERYPNLLVVRTCSKSRNLAGARLGYAMGDPALIADLDRIKFSFNPYNVNRLTLLAGEASMDDTAYFERCTRAIIETREKTVAQLRALGFTVLDSQANFVLARTPALSGAQLYQRLKDEKRILVRHFSHPRINDYCRITIGSPEQMQVFIEAVQELLQPGGQKEERV